MIEKFVGLNCDKAKPQGWKLKVILLRNWGTFFSFETEVLQQNEN